MTDDEIDPLEEKKLTGGSNTVANELLELFSGELNPVAPKAQKKVPVPDG